MSVRALVSRSSRQRSNRASVRHALHSFTPQGSSSGALSQPASTTSASSPRLASLFPSTRSPRVRSFKPPLSTGRPRSSSAKSGLCLAWNSTFSSTQRRGPRFWAFPARSSSLPHVSGVLTPSSRAYFSVVLRLPQGSLRFVTSRLPAPSQVAFLVLLQLLNFCGSRWTRLEWSSPRTGSSRVRTRLLMHFLVQRRPPSRSSHSPGSGTRATQRRRAR